MKIVHNELSSQLPDHWQDRTMLTLVAPFKPGEFASNIVITQHFVEANASLEDFAHAQQEALKQSLPAFQLLDYKATTIKNRPACQQLHRFEADNKILQQVQTFILAKRKIYAITGTATVENFNRDIPAFRQIVEDFEIS